MARVAAKGDLLEAATAMAASAVLCLLCVHPCELWAAALVAWTPFVVAVSNLEWRRAAAVGLLHGVLVNAAAFHWVYPPLRSVAELSTPTASALFLTLVVVQGARSAVVAGLAAAGMRRGWPPVLVFPLALVTGELVCPALFPWHTALFTTTVPAWMQLAEVGGPLILSAWIGAVNAGFAQAWLERRLGVGAVLRAASPALVVLSLVTVTGHWRIASVEARASRADTARIGVIQGDLGPRRHERRDPVKVYRERSLRLLETQPKLDLLVWPETAVSYPTRKDRLTQFFSDVALRNRREGAGARTIDVPLLTGMVVAHDTAKSSPRLSNSAVLAAPTGRVLGEYDKQVLVPLGEQSLSTWFPSLSRLAPTVSEFIVGDAQGSLPFAGHRLGVSICYEDILHRVILQAVREGQPDLLLNLTSDSWFEGSPGPALHLALATLRAVEHRRYLLHASTGGITAVVAPTGRVEWQLPEGPASGVASIRWLNSPTLYEKWGTRRGSSPHYSPCWAPCCGDEDSASLGGTGPPSVRTLVNSYEPLHRAAHPPALAGTPLAESSPMPFAFRLFALALFLSLTLPASGAEGDSARFRAAAQEQQYLDYRPLLVLTDAAALGLFATALAWDGGPQTELGYAGAGVYVLGGPTVHLAHGQSKRSVASLGIRAGVPAVGALAGFGVGLIGACNSDQGLGCLAFAVEAGAVGALAGGLAAIIVDDGFLGRVPVERRDRGARPATRGGIASVAPFVDPSRKALGLSVVGAF